MDKTYYFSLISKYTGKEVYTSPAYQLPSSEAFDYRKVFDVFRFYLDRVNSGIDSQLESSKTPPEVKASLKHIDPSMFKLSFMSLQNSGGHSTMTYWTKDLDDFSDMKSYAYENA